MMRPPDGSTDDTGTGQSGPEELVKLDQRNWSNWIRGSGQIGPEELVKSDRVKPDRFEPGRWNGWNGRCEGAAAHAQGYPELTPVAIQAGILLARREKNTHTCRDRITHAPRAGVAVASFAVSTSAFAYAGAAHAHTFTLSETSTHTDTHCREQAQTHTHTQ